MFESVLDDKLGDSDTIKEQNESEIIRKQTFSEHIKTLKSGDQYDLERLQLYTFSEDNLKKFDARELSILFRAFRSLGAWEDMGNLYHRSSDYDFKASPIIQESYMVALNKSKRFDETISFGKKMLENGVENGEVYGAIAKAYLEKGQLDKSAEYYEKGFLISFETYPGINVAYRAIEMGNIQKSKNVAKILQLASLRDGVRESDDYWAHAILLESSAIIGESKKKIDEIVEDISNIPANKIELWMFDSSIDAMKRVKKSFENDESFKTFSYAISKLESAKKRMEFNLSCGKCLALKNKIYDLKGALDSVSFNYRGLASNFIGQNFVGGNITFGGQLPDHCVSRRDIEEFDKLLSTPLSHIIKDECEAKKNALCLLDIDDNKMFLETIDILIRNSFSTDKLQLESLVGEGHKIYDKKVNNLLDVGGLSREDIDITKVDTRTNISVIMGLGLGDCRHHAQVKQLLFDLWQRHKMNQSLNKAYLAIHDGDYDLYEDTVKKFKEITRSELRTFDVVVHAPIKIQEKYKPVLTDEGLAVSDPEVKINEIEDHTMTILITKDIHDKIKRVEFADSFYQNHYEWGNGEMPLDKIHVEKDGKIIMPGKVIESYREDINEIEFLPVTLQPTPYCGKRDNPANDEYGQLMLLGHSNVKKDFDLSIELSKTTENVLKSNLEAKKNVGNSFN